jgi:hypothetical protein
LVNLEKYHACKAIEFHGNKDDEILNNQMNSYLSTKSKNSKTGKIINSYHNLVHQSTNFNAKSFIDAVLNPPSVFTLFKLDLSNKNEKEILKNWSARRQRFYISDIFDATYTTRRVKKKTEFISCRYCKNTDHRDTY